MSKRLDVDLYAALKRSVLKRDSWKCRYCKIRDGLQVHHIVFRSAGGEDSTTNCITLCHLCHSGVHSMRLGLLPNVGDFVDANHKITFVLIDRFWKPRR